MIEQHGHPWDRPLPDHDPTRKSVVTTPEQALTGLQIGLANLQARCIVCGRSHQEGELLRVYAYRAAEGAELVLSRCYCVECTTAEIETPTLGTSEVLVEARLDVLSLSSEQRQSLCLNEVSVLAFSPLIEGDRP